MKNTLIKIWDKIKWCLTGTPNFFILATCFTYFGCKDLQHGRYLASGILLSLAVLDLVTGMKEIDKGG
jgi:hypothetical protein